jgi:hypothetical protein
MNEEFKKELIGLAQHDLTVREKLLKENKLAQGYNPDMEKVHRDNASRLREIIDLIGWPTISKVGIEASEAAWLIAQHSIGEPTFMKQCYALMNESVTDINPQNIAYLYDRICYFEGRPQKYGTQFDDAGLYPVENKNEVNDLRQKLKLKPHAPDSIVEIGPTDNPKNLHKDAAFNEWRRNTGWI